MMRNIKAVFSLFLCALLLAGCSAQKPMTLSELSTRTPDLEGVEREQKVWSGPEYFLNAQAPVTRSAPVNRDIDSTIQAEIDAFFALLPDAVLETELGSSLTIEYEARRYNDEIITFVFEIYAYIAGSAHGLSHAITRTYNLATGERIALSDIFSGPIDETLELLSVKSYELLMAGQLGEYLDEDWLREGTAPTEQNFARFVPLPHGLELIFDPYQVGPWAIGEQRIVIPWSDLRAG